MIYSVRYLVAREVVFAQFGDAHTIQRCLGYDKNILKRPPQISERLHQLHHAMHGVA